MDGFSLIITSHADYVIVPSKYLFKIHDNQRVAATRDDVGRRDLIFCDNNTKEGLVELIDCDNNKEVLRNEYQSTTKKRIRIQNRKSLDTPGSSHNNCNTKIEAIAAKKVAANEKDASTISKSRSTSPDKRHNSKQCSPFLSLSSASSRSESPNSDSKRKKTMTSRKTLRSNSSSRERSWNRSRGRSRSHISISPQNRNSRTRSRSHRSISTQNRDSRFRSHGSISTLNRNSRARSRSHRSISSQNRDSRFRSLRSILPQNRDSRARSRSHRSISTLNRNSRARSRSHRSQAPGHRDRRTPPESESRSNRNIRKQLTHVSRTLNTIQNQMVKKDELPNEVMDIVNAMNNRQNTVNDNNNENIDNELDENNQVEVIPGIKMNLNNYLSAVNAADMRKRANIIMRYVWTCEERQTLLIRPHKDKPDWTVASENDYAKIIRICMKLQKTVKLPNEDKDNVRTEIRKWVGDYLKNERSKHKERADNAQ